MIDFTVTIDNQNISSYVPYPLRVVKTLDESLDSANFQIVNFPVSKIYKPLSPINITITDGTNTENVSMAVATDSSREILCSKTYTHSITGTETTKILERRLIGGKTATNPTSGLTDFIPVILPSPITEYGIQGQAPTGWKVDYYPIMENISSGNYLDTNYSIIPSTVLTSGNTFYLFAPDDFLTWSAIRNRYYKIEMYYNNELVRYDTDYKSSDLRTLNFPILGEGQYRFRYIFGIDLLGIIPVGEMDINIYCSSGTLKYTLFPQFDNSIINWEALNQIKDVYLQGETISDTSLFFQTIQNPSSTATITSPDGISTQISSGEELALSSLGTYYINLTKENNSEVINAFTIRLNVDTPDYTLNKTLKSNKSISDVINSILFTQKALFYSGNLSSEIMLFPDTEEELSKIEAPEFCFTNQQSLWEVFSEIGGYIHAIPRLINSNSTSNVKYYLTFDYLGGQTMSSLDFDNYVINESSYSVEQYCTEVVSTVQNMVNYERDGAITDPGLDYRSLRTESAVAYMTEEGLIIRTAQPIEKLVSLTCSPLSDGTIVGDLTSYCYENSQYQCLSSYDGSFPNSKAYGIYWTQGQRNIQGLTFKNPDVVSPVFQLYAIQNIICNKTGKSNDWFSNLFLSNTLYLQNLMFTVSYIPRVTLRVTQDKALIGDGTSSQIAYNQGTTLVDSKHFGEAQKGVVERLGNIDIVRTYIFYGLDEIPKVGELVIDSEGNEYYIASMIIDYYRDFIKAQIAFSKDFNRLNAYVGIENRLRFYEVDVNQVIDRFFTIDEYCVISYEDENYNYGMAQNNIIKYFAYPFFQQTQENLKITYAISGTSNDNTNFTSVLLPVISYGIGNTMVFQYSYEDNFSAGDQVVLNGSTRVQQQVQYGDEFGNAKQLRIDLYPGGEPSSTWSQDLKDRADMLPLVESFTNSGYFSTTFKGGSKYSYNLDKDNREKINVVYQMHFVSRSKNIIIGSGIANKNPFTSNEPLRYKLYVCTNRLNKLSKTIILDSSFVEQDYDSVYWPPIFSEPKIYFDSFTPTVDGVAWAFINTSPDGTSELIYGSNTPIKAGEPVALPTITFRASNS